MGFMTKRRVTITKADMVMVLTNDSMDSPPEIHQFSSEAAKIMHEMGILLFYIFKLDFLKSVIVRYRLCPFGVLRRWTSHNCRRMERKNFCKGLYCQL